MKKVLLLILPFLFSFLAGMAQPNPGFENWHTVYTYEDPDDWLTMNFLSIALPANPLAATKATGIDKHSGNYALKVKSVAINNNPAPNLIDDTVGIAFTGRVSISPPAYSYGFPYTGRPEKLEFWAKYTPVGLDTGGARVFLQKWNGTKRDTIALGEMNITTTPTYTMFKLNLNYYLNDLPDTAVIGFASSKTLAVARIGSVIFVDDVSLQGWVGIDEHQPFSDKVKVFPNPAKDNLTIEVTIENAEDIRVVNVFGKLMGIYKIRDSNTTVNCSQFEAGSYYYEIRDKQPKVFTTGKFNVGK